LPGDEAMKDCRMELKVCEGCGALWLRNAGRGVYCRGCALWLSEFPAPRGRRAARRKRVAGMATAVMVAGGAR
jgi:hypothetical protein